MKYLGGFYARLSKNHAYTAEKDLKGEDDSIDANERNRHRRLRLVMSGGVTEGNQWCVSRYPRMRNNFIITRRLNISYGMTNHICCILLG